jgi:hypothetical protein
LQSTAAGEPATWFIAGEAGVGKTGWWKSLLTR